MWLDMTLSITDAELDVSQALRYRRQDATSLAASLLGVEPEELPESIRRLVCAYHADLSRSVEALAEAVWCAAQSVVWSERVSETRCFAARAVPVLEGASSAATLDAGSQRAAARGVRRWSGDASCLAWETK